MKCTYKKFISERWRSSLFDFNKYDVVCELNIGQACNYRCDYCFVTGDKTYKQDICGYSIEEVKKAFDCSAHRWLIRFLAGEPFCNPSFIGLCKALVERHYIAVISNLSSDDIYKFVEEVPSSRVIDFKGSYHFGEVKKHGQHEDFFLKAKFLKEKGFHFTATVVFYPPYIDKIIDVLRELEERKIPYYGRVFRGSYKGRSFPSDYSEQERMKIWEFLDVVDREFLLKGDPSFLGAPCLAGTRHVNIRDGGRITRCASIAKSQGNLFNGFRLYKGPTLCTSLICKCFHYGYFLSDHSNIVSSSWRMPLRRIIGFLYKLCHRWAGNDI